MLTIGISFVANICIILAMIYGFNLIGQVANNKFFKERFKYSIPIGFAWFMVSFQLLSFPFILLQTSFSIFLLCFGVFSALWIIYLVLNRKYFKFKFSLKNNVVEILVILFVAVFLVGGSNIFSDSWLYSSMISSTIENNLIYSSNGTLSNVQLTIMHHRFESYYLWQAVLSLIFVGKYLIVLVTEYKLFDSVLLVLTMMELGYQFKFSKPKSGLFAAVMFSLLIAQHYLLDLSVFQTSEPPVQLFQISTGTALYHYYIIPFLIIYMKIRDQFTYKQNNIYLLGLLAVFSSLSTTFYYTFPLYLIVLLTIDHLFRKKKNPQLVLAFLMCWLIILISFIGEITMSLLACGLFTIGYLVLSKIILFIYKKLSIKFINITTITMYIMYGIVALVVFNPIIYGSYDFTTDKEALRLYNIVTSINNGDILGEFWPIAFLLFTMALLIILFTKKEFRIYSLYIILFSALFLNPFALSMYKLIGIEPVISRIYAMTFIGYLIIIVSFIKFNNHIIRVMIIIVFIMAVIENVEVLSGYSQTKNSQRNAIESNMDGLAEYNFEPNSFVVFDNLNASKGSEVYFTGVNKLVVLKPSLSWDPNITSCDQLYENEEYTAKFQHCYTIYNTSDAEDLTYVYETDKYLVSQEF